MTATQTVRPLMKKLALIAVATSLIITPAVGTIAFASPEISATSIVVLPDEPTVAFDPNTGVPYLNLPEQEGITFTLYSSYITGNYYIFKAEAVADEGYIFPWGSNPRIFSFSDKYQPVGATIVSPQSPHLTG